ncbi:MAG: RNA polymerase sigma factor [Acidimicrobiales bacterium]
MVLAIAERPTTDADFNDTIVPLIPYLYRVALSLTRKPAGADDLVQDTLLRAYRAYERFDGRYPKAWLVTIMRNANINNGRKKSAVLLDDPDTTFEHSTAFATGDEPSETVVEPVFDEQVAAAFNTLPEVFKQVIELVDIGDLSYQEAADLLDIPPGTVMSRLHRGRKRIRESLAETNERPAGRNFLRRTT